MEWGLVTGLLEAIPRSPNLQKDLSLARDEIAMQANANLAGLLAAFADADAGEETGRRGGWGYLGLDDCGACVIVRVAPASILMAFRFFPILASDPGPGEAELNRFLAGQKLRDLRKEMVTAEGLPPNALFNNELR